MVNGINSYYNEKEKIKLIDTTAARTLYGESGLNDKIMPNLAKNLPLKWLSEREHR